MDKIPFAENLQERELESRIAFEDFISRAPYERDTSIFDDNSAWTGCYKDISVHLAFDSWKASRNVLLGGEIITESKAAVNSFKSFCSLISTLWALFCEHKYLRVSWSTKKGRTISMNALWFSMYQRISQTMGDGSAGDIQSVRAECKLNLGVPIMRRDCERFEAGWARYFAKENYATQLFLMGPNPLFGQDGFPVTRLFDTKQGCEYTEAIARQYGPLGVFFDDLLSN